MCMALRAGKCGADNIGAHHHARPAARGGVVDIAVFANAKIAQVVGVQLPAAFVQGLSGQARPQHAGE